MSTSATDPFLLRDVKKSVSRALMLSGHATVETSSRWDVRSSSPLDGVHVRYKGYN